MKEKITSFLQQYMHLSSIAGQYKTIDGEMERDNYNDPLMEDSHEVVPGLIHKFPHRVLIKVSYHCAAHCRFCTRIRQIGDRRGTLTEAAIAAIIIYLKEHPEINEVILSGGDPLVTPATTATLLLQLRELDTIKVFRIGTRLPFQSPRSLQSKSVLHLLDQVHQIGLTRPFYVLLHVEHPDELTRETRDAIRQLRQYNVTLLSQSVFLKEINDDVDTLYHLFTELYHLGVIPYYLYRCDNVKGLERFQVDIKKERHIAMLLRSRLSGIACPLHVEDSENGYAKIPL